jgi:NAD+ synthase
VLAFDPEAATTAIERAIVNLTGRVLKRRGVVIGVSGGVDSAVCLALALRALGPGRVAALLMPERETDDDVTTRGASLCQELGVPFVVEEIGSALEALGCYERRDAAIREVFPSYGPGYRQKVTIAASLLDTDRVNFFNLTVESPAGERATRRMGASAYSAVVAATNMKQRTRKMIEYFHAESSNYAVLGTPNRLEYELGFFVRGGDGLADLKPIAHLFKTQVYALAAHLDLPVAIREQPPTTDTYTLPQTQEEFYFALPYADMDLLLWAWEQGVPSNEVGDVMGLEARQVERVYRDIESKRRAAARGLAEALLVEPVELPAHP